MEERPIHPGYTGCKRCGALSHMIRDEQLCEERGVAPRCELPPRPQTPGQSQQYRPPANVAWAPHTQVQVPPHSEHSKEMQPYQQFFQQRGGGRGGGGRGGAMTREQFHATGRGWGPGVAGRGPKTAGSFVGSDGYTYPLYSNVEPSARRQASSAEAPLSGYW